MATALELGPEGWKTSLEPLRSRPEHVLSPEQFEERDRLIEKAREAAAMLKERYGAKRVILFGSLAHDLWFDEWTDVDLAVDGLTGTSLYRAWFDAVGIIQDRNVDLIPLQEVRPSVARTIAEHGREL